MTLHLTHKVQPPKSTSTEHIPVHEGRLHTLPALLACLWLLFVRPHHLINPLAFTRSHRLDECCEADLCHVTPAVHSQGGKSWWAQSTEIQEQVCSVPTSSVPPGLFREQPLPIPWRAREQPVIPG